MRNYPRNSPEAAARILALLLIADGNVCRTELQRLESLDAAGAIGLEPDGLLRIVQALCEDLMVAAPGGEWLSAPTDEATLAALFDEFDEPALRRTVLSLAEAAVEADRHVADGESRLLDTLRRHWRIAKPVGEAA